MFQPLLIIAALFGGADTVDRISLPRITAGTVAEAELRKLYPVLEEALAKASGACVVSQHRIDAARARGQRMADLTICGRPMINAATPVSYVVAADLGQKNEQLVFKLELIDVARTVIIADQHLVVASHSELRADLPALTQALFADLPKPRPATKP